MKRWRLTLEEVAQRRGVPVEEITAIGLTRSGGRDDLRINTSIEVSSLKDGRFKLTDKDGTRIVTAEEFIGTTL